MSWLSGEERAWKILADCNPEDVSRRAKVTFDRVSGQYVLKSFGLDILVSPMEKKIVSNSLMGDILLHKLSCFSILSILCYLNNAQEVSPTAKLVRPEETSGGQIYLKGSHILPLDKIAYTYGNDVEGFLLRGNELGGEQLKYGDASLRLFPFPRIPIIVILWKSDEEFPARVDLLFDSTCDLHLPADVVWSTAMMSVLIML